MHYSDFAIDLLKERLSEKAQKSSTPAKYGNDMFCALEVICQPEEVSQKNLSEASRIAPAEKYPAALYTSDYSPDTRMTIVRGEDGDVTIKIKGPGPMRIATYGGKLHGQDMVTVMECFDKIIEIFNKER